VEPVVLVVEDDNDLRDLLARGLREAGFRVRTAADGSAALRTVDRATSAVVLDIGLPDSDGRDVCAAMRARGLTLPVVFLTARGDVTDRLSGFAAGGDDYLSKPFHIAELVARLRVALRRVAAATRDLSDEPLVLDPAAHGLRTAAGQVPLSPTEFRLLACLLGSAGAVVRRRELRAAGWPFGAVVADNTLDQYVTKLRRKLVAAGDLRQLTTVRGVGYRLE
jgi:two-component system response regulator MprA